MRAKRLVSMVGALAAVVSGLSAAMVAGSGVAAAAPSCPRMYVVAIPGTWETTDKGGKGLGMLGNVTRGLPSDVRTEYVKYPATGFPWEGAIYGSSKKIAVDRGRAMIAGMAQRCAGTKIGIIGYSQGADAAGDLAAEIGTGRGVVPADRVAAVGLLSDPRRSPTDALVGSRVGGFGIEGARPGGFGWVSPVVRTYCAYGDLICSTDRDNYAVRFAGFLTHISALNLLEIPTYAQEFGAIMGDLMGGGGMGMLASQFTDSANAQRAKMIQKFYGSGAHVNYGSHTGMLRGYLAQAAG